jgi:ribosome maturation factor RimP
LPVREADGSGRRPVLYVNACLTGAAAEQTSGTLSQNTELCFGRRKVSRKDTIEEKAWELLLKVCSEQGLIPVDAEYAKTGGEYNLLMYIDKEGGVGIDECEACSRALDPLLDEENFISDPYTLIVSSPGLGRPLKRPRDFLFAAGREVEVHTYKPVDGVKEFTGILKSAENGNVTIESDGREYTFGKADISLIRLAFDF